jgi:phage terminase large subunit-like protein
MTNQTHSRHLSKDSVSHCEPSLATNRSPERKTYGSRVTTVARELGTPLMPWQQLVADVALEIDPATGLLAYREITLTVPRQSGKTTLILALAVQRALGFIEPQRIIYSAQTRLDARQKWEDDQLPILAKSSFGPPMDEGGSFYKVRKTTGNEAILWRNGSRHGIIATTLKSGHGQTLDLGFVDEAFAQEDNRLETAFKPTMITRKQPQLWNVSTAGDDRSTYLHSKVDAGRACVKADLRQGIAYFEWSAPIKADPADEETWWNCMPALGRTISIDAIRADYNSMTKAGNLAEFRRSYLNQWLDAIPDEWLVIPQGVWEGAFSPPISHGDVAIAIDVTPKRTFTTICAAWRRPDGNMDVEVIEHRPGTAWVPKRVGELVKKWRPVAPEGRKNGVVIDPSGPAGPLIDLVEQEGVEVMKINARETAQACGRFFDMVTDSRTLRHNNEPVLNAAVAGAIRRDLGDGWAWARKGTSVDISPLVATTLAIWAHDKFAIRKAPYDLLKSVR